MPSKYHFNTISIVNMTKWGAAKGRATFAETAEGRLPYGWVSMLGRQGGNANISHGGICFLTVEYHFPLFNFKSHGGISHSTIA